MKRFEVLSDPTSQQRKNAVVVEGDYYQSPKARTHPTNGWYILDTKTGYTYFVWEGDKFLRFYPGSVSEGIESPVKSFSLSVLNPSDAVAAAVLRQGDIAFCDIYSDCTGVAIYHEEGESGIALLDSEDGGLVEIGTPLRLIIEWLGAGASEPLVHGVEQFELLEEGEILVSHPHSGWWNKVKKEAVIALVKANHFIPQYSFMMD
jgi:hypothetical protein